MESPTAVEDPERVTPPPMDSVPPKQLETRLASHLRILKQVVMVSGVCLGSANMGLMLVWPNVAVVDLHRDNSTLYGSAITLSDTQTDMVGSFLPAGSILGTLAGGQLVPGIGRRKSMMLLTIPCVVSWVLLALSYSPAMILAGRLVSGVYCGAVIVTGSTYSVELPDIPVRGALATFPTIFLELGYIIVLVSGLGLRWYQIPLVGIGMSITCLIAMYFIPESPSYLTALGQENEAREILRSLRGFHADIESEMNDFRTKNKTLSNVSFLNVLKMPAIRKSLAILLVLFFLNSFCGMAIFIVNMTRIFSDSGTQLNETISTLIVFLTLFVGTTVSAFFLDRIGRRNCMVISLSILALCLVTFGAYLHSKDFEMTANTEEFKTNISASLTSTRKVETESYFFENHPPIEDAFETPYIVSIYDRYESGFEARNESMITRPWASEVKWLPVTCLLVFMAGASIGITQVPFILSSEYFPSSVRAQASSICILASCLFNVLALQLFTPMKAALTPAGFYWFTAGICALGAIFSFAFVVETKGQAIG